MVYEGHLVEVRLDRDRDPLRPLAMLGCRRVTEHGLEVLDLAPLRVVDHLGAVQAAVDVRGNVAGLLAHDALRCLYQFVDDLLLAVTGDCEHFTSDQALADGDHCHGLILGRRHLEYVLSESVEHYQEARPHPGVGPADAERPAPGDAAGGGPNRAPRSPGRTDPRIRSSGRVTGTAPDLGLVALQFRHGATSSESLHHLERGNPTHPMPSHRP